MNVGIEAGTGHPRTGGRWRILFRLVAILLVALVAAGAVYAARLLLHGRRKPPEAQFSGRVAPGSLIAPGASGALVFWRTPEGVYVARAGSGLEGMLVTTDGLVGYGSAITCVTDEAAGTVKVFNVDSPGLAPAETLKAAGVTMAAADQKNTVLVLGQQGPGKSGFKIRVLDQRKRVVLEKSIPEKYPLAIRSWPGGLFVLTALEAKDYPSASVLLVSDKGAFETKGVPGLIRCSSANATAGLVAVGCSDSLFAYDLAGQLKWSVEPGGSPVDTAVTPDGVAVCVARPVSNNVERLFVRDFVAMYDVRGIRLWKADIGPGVSCVRAFDGGVVVGAASGVKALNHSGKTLWEIDLPSPVTALEVTADGSTLLVATEAGEISSYSLE